MHRFRRLFFAFTLLLLIGGPVLARDCAPTDSMTPGTHYKPVTTNKIDIGMGLIVSGRILSAVNCRPIADAKIVHWQAGENGQYQDRLRAYLPSDNNGRYRFNTEWPAAIIPHVHFIVSAKGFKTVGTQWVGNERIKKIEFDIVLRPE